MTGITEKTAVVTGGAQGIGRAIALSLAAAGADIVVADMNEDAGRKTAEEIKNAGRRSLFLKADVSVLGEAEKLFEEASKTFPAVHILVNNAGITRDALLLRMSEPDWDLVMSVNLKGTFNCTKTVLKQMTRQRFGRIINIASVIGIMGNAGQSNYAASKAGIIGFTKSIAKEVGSRGVTVNAIAPGFIDTLMTQVLADKVKEWMMGQIPLGRFGTPGDVANAVVFLASEEASYITGHVLNIDGGMAM